MVLINTGFLVLVLVLVLIITGSLVFVIDQNQVLVVLKVICLIYTIDICGKNS